MIGLIALPILGKIGAIIGSLLFFLYDFYQEATTQKVNQQAHRYNRKNSQGKTLLMEAIINNQGNIALDIINSGEADLSIQDNNRMTALLYAAEHWRERIVKAIVNKYEEFNGNELGRALVIALTQPIYYNYGSRIINSTAKALIKHKDTNLNFKGPIGGRTALMISLDKSLDDVSNLLLSDDRIDLNVQDHSGNTAPMIAASKREMREFLLPMIRNKKVHLNKINNEGKTLLMLAIISCKSNSDYQPVVLEIINKAAVKLELRDNFGSSAQDYAIKSGNTIVTDRIFRIIRIKDLLPATNMTIYVIHLVTRYDGVEIDREFTKSAS